MATGTPPITTTREWIVVFVLHWLRLALGSAIVTIALVHPDVQHRGPLALLGLVVIGYAIGRATSGGGGGE